MLAVLLAGFVYLTLNPPLSLPETGYLSKATERDMRLGPDATVAAFQVRVWFDPNIFLDSYAEFEPARLTAAIRSGASTNASLTVRLYPADGKVVDQLDVRTDGASLEWRIDCESRPSPREECARDYLAVVTATDVDGEVNASLELFAEQRFPAHVATPFWVSIGLDARAVDLPDEATLRLAEASQSVSISTEAPVAHYRLSSHNGSGRATGGAVLQVSAERSGDPIPTGLGAPPPVRLALLDADGVVLADLGLRPGTQLAASLPPLAGDHQIVVWWQDRADQAYEVTWRIELGQLAPDDVPRVEVSPAERPEAIRETQSDGGVQATVGSQEFEIDLGIPTDIGEPFGPDHLPSAIGVLHVRLEFAGSSTDEPVLLLLSPDGYGTHGQVPVPLRPSEAAELAIDGLPGCAAYSCDSWRGALSESAPFAQRSQRRLTVSWDSLLRVWPLDPTRTEESR